MKPQKTRTPPKSRRATEQSVVRAAAVRHGVPPWLLWGIYGAESTYGTNGSNYFGLIEPEYKMANGNSRRPKNTADLAESSDIAAELLASLKQETGSWAGAVSRYAPYDISHPRELSKGGQDSARKLVDAPFHLPLPGPLDPGNIWEEAEGVGGAIGGLFGGGGPSLPGKAGEIEGAIGGVADIAKFFVGFGELLLTPEGWARLAKLIFGAIAILWGIDLLIRQTTGSDIASGTKRVAESAAALAVVK